jgi:exonuclease III
MSALSIMSYNIMDSGYADASSRYDPVGDRVPGNLTDYVATFSPSVDVLGVVETSSWTAEATANHSGYTDIAHAWGFEHVHVRSNCAIMSHEAMVVLEEPQEGSSTIVALIAGITYIVTSMSSASYPSKSDDFKALGELANRYRESELILMGDLNAISHQDRRRYNETLLCGNGTYNADAQSGEYVTNFCLDDDEDDGGGGGGGGGSSHLDFSPMESLLNTTDLADLCFISGGFYDIDSDSMQQSSQCGFSNPTLLIHMTGDYGYDRGGSHGHDHAMAKIDYILANTKMLSNNRFHHTTVLSSFQADGASDHYPIEATFLE